MYLYIITLVLILLAITAGAYYYFYYRKSHKESYQAGMPIAPSEDNQAYQHELEEADKLRHRIESEGGVSV